MANDIINIKDVGSIIAKMAAKDLEDSLHFCKSIDKEGEDSFTGQVNGYNKGDTININVPARFTTSTGSDATSNIQDIKETRVPLQLTTQRHIAVEMTTKDIATDLALKSWSKRVLKPAMISMGHAVENDVLSNLVDKVGNHRGTPGSTNFDTDDVLAAGELLDWNLCPQGERKLLLNPAAQRKAVNARKGLFQSSSEISSQYKLGYMGTADGFDFMKTSILPTHTNGNDVTGVAVEADVLTPATGATQLGVDGLTTTTGTVKAGTVFTIDGVYAVHPQTKETLDYLQQFTVLNDETADGAGKATLDISPTIYSSASGSLQNVSALPADEASITFVGSASTGYAQNLAYHPSAFRAAFAPLTLPGGLDMAGQETYKGITVRAVRDYAILTDKMIMRLDVLYGYCAVRPEWACRIYS